MKGKSVLRVPAMAFYHQDGFVPVWKQAARFAGEGGRIATLPDIINARIETDLGSTAWERYFSPAPPERFGILRNAAGVSLKKGSRIFNYRL